MRSLGGACRRAGLALVLEASLALGGCAGAGAGMGGAAPVRVDFEAATNPPRGYLVYCSREPGRCGDKGNALVWLTKARWDELVKVNDFVNVRTVPLADEEAFGLADYWTAAEGAGDCEDVALEKRAQLVKRGWPKSALLLAVADAPKATARAAPAGPERHVVLLAFTDQGTFVLDSRTRAIVDWSRANYRWSAVESPNTPLVWQAVKRARR